MDCTAGGGGHSYEIARRLPEGGRLISLDRDPDAIAAATERLREFGDRVTLVKSDYSDVGAVLDDLGAGSVNGVMWDLGVSSFQLDEGERGFSYMKDAPLDMRMDRSGGITAADVVNGYSAEELKRIIWEYGEEKFAGPVARNIVKAREKKRIKTTGELAALIAEAMPAAARRTEAQHPAASPR